MRKIIFFTIYLLISGKCLAQEQVEQSLWTQALVAFLPLFIIFGLFYLLLKIARSMFTPWLDRHVEAMEKIEQHLSTMSGIDALPREIKQPETNPDESKWKE